MDDRVPQVIQHPEFQARWPHQLAKASEGQWTIAGNDGRPSMHAAGIGGQLTGHRANFLIWDDLLKSQSDAYSEVVRERIWADFSSAAETRLLPDGKIIGVQTRWHLSDVIGRLLRRAQEDRYARQFLYISLAAWNGGHDSFVLNTQTSEKAYLPKYRALAKQSGQPYSFSRAQLEGKRSDLGATRWAALYMCSPVAGEEVLFPEMVWRTVKQFHTDDIGMIVTAWDCASKTSTTNDYSANVAIAQMQSGGYVVLDVWKSRLSFAQLPQVVMERYKFLGDRYGHLPCMVIEDANSGTQLAQIIRAQYPELPLIEAKPVHSKIIRAEGVTPITAAGLVALPADAEWRPDFIAEMANFPVGLHDDICDAYIHGMKAFYAARDFRTTNMKYLPGRVDEEAELLEEMQMKAETAISADLDAVDDAGGFGWG